jgi:phosphoribosyl-AMP cyclohydrolase / phosphoribosyl-ATP pyrophosphohydrolase
MSPEFSKYADGLVPVIVQDANSRTILMLGFMNEEALAQTIREGKITFYSRSKQRLWTKGESSGHYLQLKEILIDCDNDTLLIKAVPAGHVCHTGADTCFGEINTGFSLQKLEGVIADRKANPTAASYTASLFEKGLNKIAQKVGEEAVELVIESKDNDDSRFLNEAADLLYHYLILLQQKNFRLSDVEQVLSAREK